MNDTTDTDDLTPAGEGTPIGEAEPSREWKDERIKELGGYTEAEIIEVVRDIGEIPVEYETDRYVSGKAQGHHEACNRLRELLNRDE